MNNKLSPDPKKMIIYEIQMQGNISKRWTEWFGNLHIAAEDEVDRHPITTVIVEVADQAALLGTMQKLHNLGFPLLQVRRRE